MVAQRRWIVVDELASESGGIRLTVMPRRDGASGCAPGTVPLLIEFLWPDRTVEVHAMALLEPGVVEALADALDVECHAGS